MGGKPCMAWRQTMFNVALTHYVIFLRTLFYDTCLMLLLRLPTTSTGPGFWSTDLYVYLYLSTLQRACLMHAWFTHVLARVVMLNAP